MANPIADLFVKAINFDAVDKLSLDDLKRVNAIFDGAEEYRTKKGDDDGEEEK
jgi:hypothetical protein